MNSNKEYIVESIAIIGAGLIGTSIALAAKKYQVANNIIAYDTNQECRNKARKISAFDKVVENINEIVLADIVFICTPPAKIVECAIKISPYLKGKKNVILTDVGSVKVGFYAKIKDQIPKNVCFIPGHPIAGTEKSGPQSGMADLFQNRYTILIENDDTQKNQLQKLTDFWQKCGSYVKIMDEQFHDMTLAVTSHLPHIIAYNMVYTGANIEKLHESEIIRYSASGFRDFTRMAASNPVMWTDIVMMNKKNILDALEYFEYGLSVIKEAIENNDTSKIFDIFKSTRYVKDEIVKQKQYNDK